MKRLAIFAVSVLLFAIPWENVVTFDGGRTIARFVGYAVMLVCLFAFSLEGRLRRLHEIHMAFLALVVYAAVTNFWTINSDASLQSTLTMFQLFVMMALIWQVAITREAVATLMRAYVFGAIVAVAFTIQSFSANSSYLYQRYEAEGCDPNDLALALVLSIPMAAYLARRSKATTHAMFYYVYVGAVLFAVGLTASRGGALAAIAALTVFPVTWLGQKGRSKIGALVLLAIVMTVGLMYVPQSSWSRLVTVREEISAGTMNGRTISWGAGFDSFSRRPFLGAGTGAFRSSVLGEIPDGMVAHNTFLSVAVELGIVGIFIIAVLIVSVVRIILRAPQEIRSTWLPGLLALGVGISALSWIERKPLWIVLSLAIAHASCGRDEACVSLAHRQQWNELFHQEA